MDKTKQLFSYIPDTVIITDSYGYVLDFNHEGPFKGIKKGDKLNDFYEDFPSDAGNYSYENRIYSPKVTPVTRAGKISGYTFLLVDVTEKVRITEELERKSEELKVLSQKLKADTEQLEELALRVKEISAYEEQLRIARNIHDDSGHAITEIHTISQMCLKLKDTDPQKYRELLEEGLKVCQKALSNDASHEFTSIADIVDNLCRISQFPVEASIEGEEPENASKFYAIIARILKEAYHNTLDHSLADKLFVEVSMNSDKISLKIKDNGNFRGNFEKGFGLIAMEEYVKASGGTVEFTAVEGQGFGINVLWEM